MATRTQSRSSNRGAESRSSDNRSAFSFQGAGPILAAGIAGAAIGFAANLGRKAQMQGMAAAARGWDELPAAAHDLALDIFDGVGAAEQTQTFNRKMLLMKLNHARD